MKVACGLDGRHDRLVASCDPELELFYLPEPFSLRQGWMFIVPTLVYTMWMEHTSFSDLS